MASGGYICATVHQFKSNISKYMRMLDAGHYAAVKIYRYDTLVGIFQTVHSLKRYQERQKLREAAQSRGDDMALILDDLERTRELDDNKGV